MEETNFERNLGFLLGDVARLTRTAFDRRVQPIGLTRSQWWVLTYVFRDQGLTQSELANHLELGKVATGKLIDRLEAKGWLERRPDASDRRIKRIYLQPAAEPLLDAMREPSQDLYGMLVAGLSSADQERLVDMLITVRRNLINDSDR
ncbi:MAG: MarR family transcriptional regulator [Alphaproteobacteria bacterium]|jgi:DNA-binding MarR family transcriptional regulator|nr:MarR family transcriptional regulator [Alphaproteobacteria bacterium]